MASREKKVSLAKRPWLPVSTLMNEVSWKLALSRRRVFGALEAKPGCGEATAVDHRLAACIARVLMEPANIDQTGHFNRALGMGAASYSNTPPSERDSANRFFFMGSPGLGRVVNKVKNECLGSCAIALSAAVALPMAAWWRTSLACQKAQQVLCPGFASRRLHIVTLAAGGTVRGR